MNSIKTMVAVTAEESSPGVPVWGPNSNATQVPEGETNVAIENLIAGQKYYVKTWNEDQWGQKSNEIVRIIQTEQPTRLTPITFSANGQFDQGSQMYAYVKIPSAAKSIQQVLVTLSFREFLATAQSADASGTITSVSGGGSTSGSSSAGSSSSDLTGLTFILASGTHTHTDPQGGSTGAATLPGAGTWLESVSGTGSHSHSIPHTHTTPNHTHDVPSHTHALIYGTFEEPYPASHNAVMTIYHREASGWVQKATISGFTYDLQDADLTSYFNATGDWRLGIKSAGGTPQGGRLSCDVFGTVTVTI